MLHLFTEADLPALPLADSTKAQLLRGALNCSPAATRKRPGPLVAVVDETTTDLTRPMPSLDAAADMRISTRLTETELAAKTRARQEAIEGMIAEEAATETASAIMIAAVEEEEQMLARKKHTRKHHQHRENREVLVAEQ